MRAKRVWPIQPCAQGMPVIKDHLANSIDRPSSPDAIQRLTEWVNRLGIDVLTTGVGVHTGYNAVAGPTEL